MTAETIRLLAVLPYPLNEAPSQRFRIEQWTPHLERLGCSVQYAVTLDSAAYRAVYRGGSTGQKMALVLWAAARALPRLLRNADAIFLHRHTYLFGPALPERLMRLVRPHRAVIYDFDDAIFLHASSGANKRFEWLKSPNKTADLCRLADAVSVGNTFLGDYARKFNHHVAIVPTTIDTDTYVSRPKNQGGGRVILGWTGSATSQVHLEIFAPILKQILAECPVDLRVVSNRRPLLPEIPHEWREWTPETEVASIQDFDIGIMPMPDDEWSKGKCSLKALQSMAVGVPVVASAIGANRDAIDHGRDSLLASSPEEWIAAVRKLATDHEYRLLLGKHARTTIEQRFSAPSSARTLFELVQATRSRVASRLS